MSRVMKAIEDRVKSLNNDPRDEEFRTVSTRLTLSEVEKLVDVTGALDMNKAEFIRMVVVNALDDTIEKYNMKFERAGLSQVEQFDFEEMTPQERKEFLQKEKNQ